MNKVIIIIVYVLFMVGRSFGQSISAAEVQSISVRAIEVKPIEIKPIEVKPIEVRPIETEIKPIVDIQFSIPRRIK